ncbi:MAG: BTAD domain-containing putative transcriptional regulator [Anaerolineales bacterium]|nr:AAA family ATPase [Anaerolineales bacterium]MDW8447835.1 BTAD domain-containing putative transcriptional regulator [Anaerolineales bacterium]
MENRLEAQLLGTFRLMLNGEEVKALQSERLILLMARLLLSEGLPIRRSQLAQAFWPGTSEEQARTNLRKLLHLLRKAFPPLEEFFELDQQTIRLKKGVHLRSDVGEFRAVLQRISPSLSENEIITELQKAVHLYHGEFLPGFYDEWVLALREELQQFYLAAVKKLSDSYEEKADYETAIEHVQRLLRHNPLDEALYQRLIHLHLLKEDRSRALSAYHECASILKRELGIEPTAETQALYSRILKFTERKAEAALSPPVKRVGRRKEWQELKNAWFSALRGKSCFLLLKGESGTGTTFLAQDFATWVERQGFSVAVGRCYAAEGELAYGAVTQWLRSFPEIPLPDLWRIEVSRLRPDLLREHSPPPPPLTEVWQQHRFHEGIAQAFLSFQPLLLVCDDIHWADRKTIEWLRFFFRFQSAMRTLVLATARQGNLESSSPLGDLLQALRSSGDLIEIPLQRFGVSETRQLAEQIAQTPLSESAVQHLYEQSEGLPLFIVELAQADPSFEWPTDHPVPQRIQNALHERFESLSPQGKQITQVAAVIGCDFSIELLSKCSDLSENEMLLAIDELWQRHIFRQVDQGTYDFTHAQLRQFIYAQLPPHRRQAFHRRVAAALEELNPADSLGIALHLEKGGYPDRAAQAFFAAAQRENAQAAYSSALYGFQQALCLSSEAAVERKVEILIAIARLSDILGEPNEAEAAIQQALQLTAAIDNAVLRVKALAAAANLAMQQGNLADGRLWFEMATKIAQLLSDQTHFVQLLIQLGDLEYYAGDGNEARRRYQEGLEAAQRHNFYGLAAEAAMGMGFVLPAVGGSFALAQQYMEESARLYRMMGDRLGEARALTNLASLLQTAGKSEQAIQIGEEAFHKNQTLRYRRGAATARSSQAMAAFDLGDFAQARANLEEVRQEFRAIGIEDGYGLHSGNLGLVAMAEGNLDEAEALFREALAIAGEHGTAIFAAMHHQDLASLYVLKGCWAEAKPHLEAALAINQENGDQLGILYDQTLLGRVAWEAGASETAFHLADEVMQAFRQGCPSEGGTLRWLWQLRGLLQALDRADQVEEVDRKGRELYQATLQNIQNPAYRQSFLRGFPHYQVWAVPQSSYP